MWRRQLYSRVRLRLHLLKKDIRRRQETADAGGTQAAGREHVLREDKNKNETFWKKWQEAEDRDWNELQSWQATDYLQTSHLREPKPEAKGARNRRKKKQMENDPEHREKVKQKRKQRKRSAEG